MDNPDRVTRRPLPMAPTNAARVLGGVGAFACVLCCVSIPSIVAAIGALGLGFLRNDRLLLPVELVSLVVLIATLVRSRAQHGRNAPLVLGLAAASCLWFGLQSRPPFGTIAALSGAVAVVLVVYWDWTLHRRCAATI